MPDYNDADATIVERSPREPLAAEGQLGRIATRDWQGMGALRDVGVLTSLYDGTLPS